MDLFTVVELNVTKLIQMKRGQNKDAKDSQRREAIEIERQMADSKQTEDLLQQLLDSMSDALVLVDNSGRITRVNQAARKLLKFSEEERENLRISTLLPASPIPSTPAELLSQKSGGRLYLETQARPRWGHLMQISASCDIVRDSGGNVSGMLLVVRDIAERKQAEAIRSRLAAIVESSDDAIVGKDLNGIINSWNAAAERMFGYTAEEVIGKSILVLIPRHMHAQEAAILRRLRAGERIEHFETERIAKDGKVLNVSLTISPVKDDSGQVIGASKIARDISQRKKAEETLRRTEKLAAAGRLAATIAHEINNPLEAVTNLLYLAKKDRSKTDKYLEMANEELARINHIARQTLGFYRDTSSPVSIYASEILEDVLTMYLPRMESRGINVKRQYDKQAEMIGLVGEVRQVFSNLIVNAIDSMPGGGTLYLRVSRTHHNRKPIASGVRITIADTGLGIPAENRKKIFEAFYTTKIDIGTGLGLWVTRGIVQKHKGTIRFRSKTTPGKSGTVFSVFLPRAAMQQRIAS